MEDYLYRLEENGYVLRKIGIRIHNFSKNSDPF